MSDLMQSKAEEIIRLMSVKNVEHEEEARMNRAHGRISMLLDNFADQVGKKLQKYVSSETYQDPVTKKGLIDYVDMYVNVFKAVISHLSMIYKKDPVRTFTDGEKKNEEIPEVYEKAQVDQKLKKANKYMNSVNDVALHVLPRNGKLDMDVLTPNVLRVIGSAQDETIPETVMIKRMYNPALGYVDGNVYYIVWTAEEHYKLIRSGETWLVEPLEENQEMRNPFGVLPFVFIRKSLPDSTWNETEGEDLYQMCLILNALWALLTYNQVWHNFKQLAISTDGELPPGITRSPDTAIKAPEGADVQVLDFTLAIDALQKALINYAGIVGSIYGIDLQTLLSLSTESGIKLKIKQSVLEEMRDDQIKVFEKAEQDLFDLFVKISDTPEAKDQGIEPIKGEFQIKFAEMDIYTDPKEELEITKMKIELNLLSMVDAFMDLNPTYTRDEALVELKRIIQENNELRGQVDQNLMDELNKGE